MDTKIKSWLTKLPTKKRSLALKLRSVVLSIDPSITDTVKWSNITFANPKGNIAWLLNYETTEYINLGFFKGAKLSDPKKLLEGTGKGLRHQKIRSEKDIDKKQIATWVKESIKLNKGSK